MTMMKITFTRPENVLHSPPLSEGEGLACRVLQVLFYINNPTPVPVHLTLKIKASEMLVAPRISECFDLL